MSKIFPKTHTLALTGKIGSGKSTVRDWFEHKGIPSVDCDELVHKLYEPGNLGALKIQAFFGEEYLTKEGRVNRKKLRRGITSSQKKWEVLNRMIHPLVVDQLQRHIRAFKAPYAVVEIQLYEPRLFKDLVDEVWWIEANSSIRHQRIQQRGLRPNEVEWLEEKQKENAAIAHRNLSNQGSREALKKKLEQIGIEVEQCKR